jgi:hypothetical protein
MMPANNERPSFEDVVAEVPKVGKVLHSQTLINHAKSNTTYVQKTLKDLDLSLYPNECALVISAGPGLHKFNSIQRIKDAGIKASIVATDGSYIHCLKKGIIPEFVLSLDPHPKRIVRWFGDPCFEDLDVEFRKNTLLQNQQHIELVNEHASKSKLLLCSSAPASVTERVVAAGFDIYWWNPIVDDPRDPKGLTRQLYSILKAPCMNTGGTVGTAAWVFAQEYLKARRVGVVGMDLGYHEDTPKNMTQTYYELIQHVGEEHLEECFKEFVFPMSNKRYYTDPTYYWYRKNILELVERCGDPLYNCTEGGTLYGDGVVCMGLDQFLKESKNGESSLH